MGGIRVMPRLTIYCNLFHLAELDRLRNPASFFFKEEKLRQVFLQCNSVHFQRTFINSWFVFSSHSKTILLWPQVCLFFWVLFFSTRVLFHSYFLRSCCLYFFAAIFGTFVFVCTCDGCAVSLFYIHTHNLRNCCIAYENLSQCLHHLARPQ